MVIDPQHDIYIQGAAIAQSIAEEEVTQLQRQQFKVAFFDCLWWYLHNTHIPHNDWIRKLILIFSMSVRNGRDFFHIRAVVNSLIPRDQNQYDV